jgi:hypothetical protein
MMIVAWIDFLQSKESHSSPAQTVIAVSVVLLALVALMLPHVVETFSEEVGVSFERIKDDIRWHERRLNQSEEDLVERLKDMVKVQTAAPQKSRGVNQL